MALVRTTARAAEKLRELARHPEAKGWSYREREEARRLADDLLRVAVNLERSIHSWIRNSGTTDRCERCGCWRFWQMADGTPSRRQAGKMEFSLSNLDTKMLDAPPPCVAGGQR